jgi:ubiquitin C-terminal hydrolase
MADISQDLPYGGENYYTCVAQTIDKGLMYGFPLTSPYCPGQFCGSSTARYAEVIESVYRLVRTQVYASYQAPWNEIAQRKQENISTIPVLWHPVIDNKAAEC